MYVVFFDNRDIALIFIKTNLLRNKKPKTRKISATAKKNVSPKYFWQF